MKLITQSMKEQEKVVSDSSKLVERMFREQHTQKSTYADMVRGTCDRVVKDVSAKIEALPVRVGAKETSEARTVVSDAFNDFMDKERRKLNVVVHNLPESDAMSVSERSECDKELFKDVIKEGLNLIVHPTRSFRAGKKLGDRPRLLIVSLASEEVKGDLLRMAPQLRYLSTWERIYVTPDLSKKEREEGKKLRIELTARKHAGESDIMIKRGKIVKVPAKPSSERSGQGSGPAPRAAKIGGEQVQQQLRTATATQLRPNSNKQQKLWLHKSKKLQRMLPQSSCPVHRDQTNLEVARPNPQAPVPARPLRIDNTRR